MRAPNSVQVLRVFLSLVSAWSFLKSEFAPDTELATDYHVRLCWLLHADAKLICLRSCENSYHHAIKSDSRSVSRQHEEASTAGRGSQWRVPYPAQIQI